MRCSSFKNKFCFYDKVKRKQHFICHTGRVTLLMTEDQVSDTKLAGTARMVLGITHIYST